MGQTATSSSANLRYKVATLTPSISAAFSLSPAGLGQGAVDVAQFLLAQKVAQGADGLGKGRLGRRGGGAAGRPGGLFRRGLGSLDQIFRAVAGGTGGGGSGANRPRGWCRLRTRRRRARWRFPIRARCRANRGGPGHPGLCGVMLYNLPVRELTLLRRKCMVSTGMSSRRSRRLGKLMGMTLRR